MAVEKKETVKSVETKASVAKAPAPAAKATPEVSAAVKAEAPKAAEPAVKAAPKAAEKKPAAKKETVKKTAAPKKEAVKKASVSTVTETETTAKVVIEFAGKSIAAKDVLEAATKAYAESHNGVAIKNIDIYVKPEENVAYYVVNGEGSDDFKVEL